MMDPGYVSQMNPYGSFQGGFPQDNVMSVQTNFDNLNNLPMQMGGNPPQPHQQQMFMSGMEPQQMMGGGGGMPLMGDNMMGEGMNGGLGMGGGMNGGFGMGGGMNGGFGMGGGMENPQNMMMGEMDPMMGQRVMGGGMFPGGHGGGNDGFFPPAGGANDMDRRLGRPPVQFSQMELEYYKNIWRSVDIEGKGYVEGAAGADFMKKSGLPVAALHEIWRLVDDSDVGALDEEGFFIMCRLIAHAQNGAVNYDMMFLVPPSLPSFDSIPNAYDGGDMNMGAGNRDLRSVVGEVASKGSNPVPAVKGSWSDFMASIPVTPIPQTDWKIPFSMQQKYRNLFYVMDTDADGYIGSEDAKTFLSQSGLPVSDLKLIWDLADQDEDSRLTMEEFAVALHLVNSRFKSQPVPLTLPGPLKQIIERGLATTDGIEASKSTQDEAARDIADTKSKKESLLEIVPSEKRDVHSTAVVPRESSKKENEGDYLKQSLLSDEEMKALQVIPGLRVPTAYVERSIETDKRIARQLAEDVDGYASKVQEMAAYGEKLKDFLVSEKKQLAHELDRKNSFEVLVRHERAKLERLQEQRRKLDLERIAAKRDMKHYEEEVAYLKKQIEDAKNDIRNVQSSTMILQKNNTQLDDQITVLDSTRKGLRNAVQSEEKQFHDDEKQVTILRESLDRLRREKATAQAKNTSLQERLRHGDQDRLLLMGSIEHERAKLLKIKDSRLRAAQERLDLEQQVRGLQAQEAAASLPVTASHTHRNEKGIPVGSSLHTRPHSHNAAHRFDDNPLDNSRNSSSNWTYFGIPKRKPLIHEIKFTNGVSVNSVASGGSVLEAARKVNGQNLELKRNNSLDELVQGDAESAADGMPAANHDILSLKGDVEDALSKASEVANEQRVKSDILFGQDDEFADFAYDSATSAWAKEALQSS